MPAQQPTGPAGPVVLRLTLDPGNRISGTVERAGHTGTRTFSGWVDLMSAIETLAGAPPPAQTCALPVGRHVW